MKFSELQQQLKENFGIDHLADIARELGVSPQAVSNWKARDRVPYKYVLKIRERLENNGSENVDQSGNKSVDNQEVLPQYGYTQYFEEDTISIMDVLLILVKHLRIMIIMPVIFCTLMFIHVQYRVQPVYESSAKIMSLSGGGGGISQAAGIAAAFGINVPNSQAEPQWISTEVVKSRTLARSMLKRKFDTEKYGPQKPLLQILTYGNGKPSIGLDTLIKAGVGGVIGMIDIKQNRSFYDLTISAWEPIFARDFAMALIEELDAHQREYNKTRTSETRQFIEERIVDTEKKLQGAEESLKNFP